MDSAITIIEIIDGQYRLNSSRLYSTLKLAEHCDKIALISIVGPKNHGKTFFINCLINYMFSQIKDEWPYSEDAKIKMCYGLRKEANHMRPVVNLISKPFIISEEIDDYVQRTAVFLMDSDFVFDCEMSSQIEQDILGLFLLTSSTVIYNQKRFVAVI